MAAVALSVCQERIPKMKSSQNPATAEVSTGTWWPPILGFGAVSNRLTVAQLMQTQSHKILCRATSIVEAGLKLTSPKFTAHNSGAMTIG
jgi:hypothetical protein